ncbi:MAG TPA: phage tail protein [Bryobacteraceae bacterium]|nr:phage tail protein [Bryobacteraceae bacterium]
MPTPLAATRPDPYKEYTLSLSDGFNTYFGSQLRGLIPPPEVIRHRSGGDPTTSIKSPGRLKYEPITLSRGVTNNQSFSDWAGQVAAEFSESGVSEYRDGGDSDGSPRKLTGQSDDDQITLKRGIVQDQSLSNWADSVSSYGSHPGSEVSPANFRKDIILQFYNEAGQLVIRYQMNPRRVLEFRGQRGVFYHPVLSGRLREQLAEIFQSSLDAQETSATR